MRLHLTAWLCAAGMAAVWAQAALPPAPDASAAWSSASAAETSGLRAALEAAGLAPSPGLAVARGEDGARRLRGRAARLHGPAAGWPAALYAEADPLCDAHLQRPACWRLRLLELDGEALAVPPAAAPDPQATLPRS